VSQSLHGWIVVDKPEGMTSAQVVSRIKRLFKVKKAGHGGTLDPLATGVLPIALGEATKTLGHVLEGQKAYRFEVKWGEARSTEDREGEITHTSLNRPSRQEIEKILPLFRGEIKQTPPIYSALKVNGTRAYTLARLGQEVVLAPRHVTIASLELIDALPESAVFEVVCSKGTYVRSLARDLALRLGTYGHLIGLRRLMASPFHEKIAILLDSLLKIGHNTKLMQYILPLQDALADILALEVEGKEALKLRQGQVLASPHKGEGIVLITCEGVPQALAEVRAGFIKTLRVFNIN
jgi:tRNA pseudouridine55 synthase